MGAVLRLLGRFAEVGTDGVRRSAARGSGLVCGRERREVGAELFFFFFFRSSESVIGSEGEERKKERKKEKPSMTGRVLSNSVFSQSFHAYIVSDSNSI